MNAKKMKKLRRIASLMLTTDDREFEGKEGAPLTLKKLSRRSLLKELKKSFK